MGALQKCGSMRIHSRPMESGLWSRASMSPFPRLLVSSAGEKSFRSLSCEVENSARQPTFAWMPPYSGSGSEDAELQAAIADIAEL